MKNARPTPKSRTSAPRPGAATVTRPAKASNTSASESAALVIVQRGKPMTDSLRVAAEFGKSHKHVLRSVDALQADLSPEFWRSNFGPSTYTDDRGKAQRMYLMTEDGFAMLVMGFTGRKAVSLRERFIVAFRRITAELVKLKAMQSAPSWQAARVEAKRDFRNVTDMLQEVRADAGKETAPVHYMTEAKLMRFAMTGSNTAELDRSTMSQDDLKLLGKVERLNMRLLARGESHGDRKAKCRALVLESRGLLLQEAA